MNQLNEMFHYGNFERRIIITWMEYAITTIFWIIIEQYITFFAFDDAIKTENISLILFFAILMLVKVIVKAAEGILNCILRHHLQRDFSYYARKDIFNRIINANINFFDKSNTGELLELAMNDSEQFSTFFTQNGLQTTSNLLRVITYLLILLFMDVKLGIILITIYIVGYLGIFIINRKKITLINNIRKLNILITKSITEQINGLELIKSLRIEEKRLKHISKLIEKYNSQSKKLDKVIRNYNFIYDLFSLFTLIIVGFVGGIDLLTGAITYGALIIFINGTSSIIKWMNTVIRSIEKLNNSYISFLKILKFNREVESEKETGKTRLESVNEIEFKNVKFAYNEDSKILKEINLEVGKNEKVAIIGKTGSGKTTLVNLLCRFYSTTGGKILINGKDYTSYTMHSLREKIGYVMQDVVVFKGNVYENINYANKKVTNEEIIEICKRLNLHEKIISLPQGYETDLSQNKDILSQGEKQMLNFARIMVEDPEIIILDEVTSSLSYENEELIKNATEQIMKDKICFLIAHRLSSIQSCNKIILLEDGKIVEAGNHKELIEKQGRYYNLVNA
ncbi:MAG: ABC transporter ATP-binding protein [Clostridia bacterium]|nr:ABC transporter ATP-binding protein [Clostridia bacterium]